MTKILVIEDTQPLREEIMETLDYEGFEVYGAENGRVGVQLAQAHLPDLIICDVIMPELDGYGTLKVLRQERSTESIPFIFLTARTEKVDVRQGMELGADDYLTKPFATPELLSAIAARLQKQSTINKRIKSELDVLRTSISMSLPHELRTPLNAIMGFSELMIDSLDDEEQADLHEMAQSIHHAAKLLHRLIQNYLLYAEIEIANSNPEKAKLVASHQSTPLVKAVADYISQKVKEAGRQADLHMSFRDDVVQISIVKLRKIIEEVVDNALKYSTAGTPLYVSSRLTTKDNQEGMAILSITDCGRGMTAEQIASIGAYLQFERKIYEQQGAGLGLTISRYLAELHGGSLTIESIYGKQTTVHIALPLSDQEQSEATKDD